MFELAEFTRQRKGAFGKSVYYFDQLGSTNLAAEDLARQGAEEGTVVLANEQTHGKGRKGSVWFSPRDVNLQFSLIARPQMSRLHCLPFVSALAVLRTLERFGIACDLKWPNDVLVNGKKVSGILIETSIEENVLQYVVAGFGINANTTEFPQELKERATSIAMEKGAPVSLESCLADVIFEFESLYEKINGMNWNDFCAELEEHSSYLRGCRVEMFQEEKVYEGTTEGLDAYGGLILRTEEGVKVFYAGEIRACRKK